MRRRSQRGGSTEAQRTTDGSLTCQVSVPELRAQTSSGSNPLRDSSRVTKPSRGAMDPLPVVFAQCHMPWDVGQAGWAS